MVECLSWRADVTRQVAAQSQRQQAELLLPRDCCAGHPQTSCRQLRMASLTASPATTPARHL
eukprot:5502668-Amphidinium_carterae.2